MPPEPAVLVKLPDDASRIYAQKYPFLSGPKASLNRSVIEEVPRAIIIRRPTRSCRVERRNSDEARLASQIEMRARSLFRAIGLVEQDVEEVVARLAWKFRDVRPETRTILDIGCGNGMELVFLRAAAPDARILALDWSDGLLPKLKEIIGIEFKQLIIFEYLASRTEKFELVFSNHVLEHMYDPDETLRLLRGCIAPGGQMIMAVPLDGQGEFSAERLKSITSLLDPIDLGHFDLGHPWKITASDLHESLIAAGFHNVRMIQRAERLNVASLGEEEQLAILRTRGRRLNRAVVGPIKFAIRSVFGRRPPQPVMKLFYAIERRAWFGGNNLKNLTSPEILAVAG